MPVETLIDHHTGYAQAESILWHRRIHGSGYSAPGSHERMPHFFLADEAKTPQALPFGEEIILRFSASLPLHECADHLPRPGVINRHFDAGYGTRFWQATITPDQTIRFVGAQILADRPSKLLRKLIGSRLGELVTTHAYTGPEDPASAPPAGARAWLFTLLGG